MEFATKALHTLFNKDDKHGALRMPIYNNAAFEGESAELLEEAFRGNIPYHVYSRLTNPTVEHFENTVKNLSNSLGVISLSSGMAAISNFFFAIAQSGDNFITSPNLFGNTYSFFSSTLKPFGVDFKFTDLTNIANIEQLIDKNTRGIFFEAITNPQMEVADIRKIVDLAKKYNLVVIVDTTTVPLCFLNAKELGINIEVISSTKFISGGGTAIGGLIIDHGSYNWKYFPKLEENAKKFGQFALMAKLRKEVFKNLGACSSPQTAFYMSLGLETLLLRVREACKNTQILAEWLEKHELVEFVSYPGLASSPFYELSKTQFNGKFGALLTFDFKNAENCFAFINHLKIIRRATNINDNKTLAIHPYSTIYCDYSPELKAKMKITDTMIRLSVGLEDVSDLIEDIQQAFEFCK